jgi:hypothetical protein
VVCGIVVETSQSTSIIYAFELFKPVYEFLKEIRGYLGKRKWEFFNSKKVEKMEKKYVSIKKKFTANPFGDGYDARRIVKAIESFMYVVN